MSQSGISRLGFVLVVLGIALLAWAGISYSRQDKTLYFEPRMTADGETIPIAPSSGIFALAGGIVLMVGSRRGK